jgi:hypothetical protein
MQCGDDAALRLGKHSLISPSRDPRDLAGYKAVAKDRPPKEWQEWRQQRDEMIEKLRTDPPL